MQATASIPTEVGTRLYRVRTATAHDCEAVAAILTMSRRKLAFLPIIRSPEEEYLFIADFVFSECIVTIAEDESGPVSFLARQNEEISLIYTRPDRIGTGAGSLLIERAQEDVSILGLETSCYMVNVRARHFFQARKFRPVKFTNGADNEDNLPDVRYRWVRGDLSLSV